MGGNGLQVLGPGTVLFLLLLETVFLLVAPLAPHVKHFAFLPGPVCFEVSVEEEGSEVHRIELPGRASITQGDAGFPDLAGLDQYTDT